MALSHRLPPNVWNQFTFTSWHQTVHFHFKPKRGEVKRKRNNEFQVQKKNKRSMWVRKRTVLKKQFGGSFPQYPTGKAHPRKMLSKKKIRATYTSCLFLTFPPHTNAFSSGALLMSRISTACILSSFFPLLVKKRKIENKVRVFPTKGETKMYAEKLGGPGWKKSSKKMSSKYMKRIFDFGNT